MRGQSKAASPGLLWRTVRHLKPVQVWGQLRARVIGRRTTSVRAPALACRERSGPWAHGISKPRSLLAHDVFRFLNIERRIERPRDWYEGDVTYLWFYNLHYHDWLNQAAFPGGREAALRWLRSWVDANPLGTGRAWEPYPISLRVVNWLRFGLEQGALPADLLQSALDQLRWLRRNLETHLLANHYFTNAKTLFMAGSYFAGAEADEWRSTGARILHEQLAEQVLRDGGHYERSPMYHAIVTEDVLDLLNAAYAYPNAEVGALRALLPDIAGKLLRWADLMRYPDGSLPLFNDCAQAIAPSYAELSSYAQRLGVTAPRDGDARRSLVLDESGFARLERGAGLMFCDVGTIGPSYQPGHAHAGTLSFELAVNHRALLVNTGTSTYDPGPVRSAERATSAHNTLEVQGVSSSEVWASFRVGERAHARVFRFEVAGDATCLVAEHDGYQRQGIAGVHQRSWVMRERSLEVADEVSGAAGLAVRIFFHFAPGLELRFGGAEWEVLHAGSVVARLLTDDALSYTLQQYVQHPEFGRSEPAWRLVGYTLGSGSALRCLHRLRW